MTRAGLSEWTSIAASQKPKESATVVAGKTMLFVPFRELFDVEQEKQRLQKEIAKANQEIAAAEIRLSNKSFVGRAPKEVVEKEKGQLQARDARLQQIEKD